MIRKRLPVIIGVLALGLLLTGCVADTDTQTRRLPPF